jgi:hypothetical protein
MGPQLYLANMDDAKKIPDEFRAPISVATYKGWLPNIGGDEAGKINSGSLATWGYVACLLARAVDRPGDYTGIILDWRDLKGHDRAGGMYVLDAGESTVEEKVPPVQVYPPAHGPIRAFFSAPGALGFYGAIEDSLHGRAGSNPFIVKPLDWAEYDWTDLHGTPGLRRGGGKNVPLNSYKFVRGTPVLILLSTEDAEKLRDLDHTSLLLRKARVAMVHPHWKL